jgi:hypothetical protein
MTSNRRRRTLTDAEREQRRTADRERAKQAANELLSSDGWSRWVRSRQLFSSYSAVIWIGGRRRRVVVRPCGGGH